MYLIKNVFCIFIIPCVVFCSIMYGVRLLDIKYNNRDKFNIGECVETVIVKEFTPNKSIYYLIMGIGKTKYLLGDRIIPNLIYKHEHSKSVVNRFYDKVPAYFCNDIE